ncbi:MAG TPA: SGNH/GDSL hydrolase family protein [bacterium]|nr:SGNH/GDSL hydrolase family protein [bacterium]
MNFSVKNGQRFLFIGDSITDNGRRTDPLMLGGGYVKMFKEMMLANMPEIKVDVINKGIGGNTLLDLENRWTDDMMYLKPDWLSILIGINDVHRVFRKTEGWEELTPDKYLERYRKLLGMTAEKTGCKVIILEPFYISTDKTDSQRGTILRMLEDYRKISARMSKEYNTLFIRTHDIFQKHLKYREMETFCGEPVHPNHTGHMIIAQAIFDILKK